MSYHLTVELSNYMLDQAATNKLLFIGIYGNENEDDPLTQIDDREAISFDAANDREVESDAVGGYSFTVPAGWTVREVRIYDDSSVGVMQAGREVTPQPFPTGGTYIVMSAKVRLNLQPS